MSHIVTILGAAIVAFLLGAFWYSPVLFARPWMTAHIDGGYQLAYLVLMRGILAQWS